MSVTSIITLGRPDTDKGRGQSGERVIGTKTSGPTGIESILEYNGLYLNVREWSDTYIVDSISGIDDADVLDSREPNPTDDGETPFAARYGGRTVVLGGYIETKTLWKLRDMQSALRRAFSDLSSERALIFRTTSQNTDLVLYCKKSGKIEMGEEQTSQNVFKRRFQITLRASNPRFVGYKENVSRKKWGYTETFAETSAPTVSANAIRNPLPNPTGPQIFSAAAYNVGSVTTQPYFPSVSVGANSYTAVSATFTYPSGGTGLANFQLYAQLPTPDQIVVQSGAMVTSRVRMRLDAPAGVNITSITKAQWSFSDSNGVNSPKYPSAGGASLSLVPVGNEPNWYDLAASYVTPTGYDRVVFSVQLTASVPGDYKLYGRQWVTTPSGSAPLSYFDGSFSGARWAGVVNNSVSVKYQSVPNEISNSEMNPNMVGSDPWQAGSNTRSIGYNNSGGYVTGTSTASPSPVQYVSNDMTVKENDVVSAKWTVRVMTDGWYMPIVALPSQGASKAADNSKVDSDGLNVFMKAGVDYSFYVENWMIPVGNVSERLSFGLIKEGTSSIYDGGVLFDVNELVKWSGILASKTRVTPGSMSNPDIFRTTNGLPSGWSTKAGLNSVYVFNGSIRRSAAKEVVVVNDASSMNSADRLLTMRFKTPSTLSTGEFYGILGRVTSPRDSLMLTASTSTTTAGRLTIYRRQGGSTGSLATGASTFAIAPSTVYYLQMVMIGNVVNGYIYDSTNTTLLSSITFTLTAADHIALFGAGVLGDDGIRLNGNQLLDTEVMDFTNEPYGIGPTVSHSVINVGDYAAQPIIRIYGTAAVQNVNGALPGQVAVTIVNEANGDVLSIKCKDGTFTAIGNDRYVEIDIAKKTMREYVASTGALVGAAFDRLDPSSDWLTLEPGINNLTTRYLSTSGQPQVDVRWRRTHM